RRLEQKAKLQLNLKSDVLDDSEAPTRQFAARRLGVHEIPQRHEKLVCIRLNELRRHSLGHEHILQKAEDLRREDKLRKIRRIAPAKQIGQVRSIEALFRGNQQSLVRIRAKPPSLTNRRSQPQLVGRLSGQCVEIEGRRNVIIRLLEK